MWSTLSRVSLVDCLESVALSESGVEAVGESQVGLGLESSNL